MILNNCPMLSPSFFSQNFFKHQHLKPLQKPRVIPRRCPQNLQLWMCLKDFTLPWRVGIRVALIASHKAGCSRSWNPDSKIGSMCEMFSSPVQTAQHFINSLVRALVTVPRLISISVVDETPLTRIPVVSVWTPANQPSVTDGPVPHGGGVRLVGTWPRLWQVLRVHASVVVLGWQIVVRVSRLVVSLQGPVISVVVPVHWIQSIACGIAWIRGTVVSKAIVCSSSVVAVVARGTWVITAWPVVWVAIGGAAPIVIGVTGHSLTMWLSNILHKAKTSSNCEKAWL